MIKGSFYYHLYNHKAKLYECNKYIKDLYMYLEINNMPNIEKYKLVYYKSGKDKNNIIFEDFNIFKDDLLKNKDKSIDYCILLEMYCDINIYKIIFLIEDEELSYTGVYSVGTYTGKKINKEFLYDKEKQEYYTKDSFLFPFKDSYLKIKPMKETGETYIFKNLF